MLANAETQQALINKGLTNRLDCDTVRPSLERKRQAGRVESPALDKGLILWYSSISLASSLGGCQGLRSLVEAKSIATNPAW